MPHTAAAGGPLKKYAVIYDGDCRICGRIVRRLKRWDRNNELEVLPSAEPGVKQRFPWIPDSAFAESIQVVRLNDGKTWQGAVATEQLLDALPRGPWITWIFHIPFARALAEKLYRVFARNRHRLGCGKHCRLDYPGPS